MAGWPPELPACVSADDYQEQYISGSIKSEMDPGPVKIRRRFTRVRRKFSQSMIVDSDQYEVFWNWYSYDLAGGTLPFQVSHPIDGGNMNLRFGEEPQISAIGPTAYRIMNKFEEV